MNKIILLVLIAIIIASITIFSFAKKSNDIVANNNTRNTQNDRQSAHAFDNSDLKTNTAITSIPLDDVLGGGPGKDGIPTINNPQFETVKDAQKWLTADSRGVLVTEGATTRFYPYAILYWHEIVNDTVDDIPIAVTFCPLCGTAITFDRRINDDVLQFGVSGKLYQSNLLMYDTATESLWSQARGEAIVGDFTATKLTLFPSSLITFADIIAHHADAQILSRDTGHRRNYTRSPYGDYETSQNIMFSTDDFDAQFHPKELFAVAPTDTASVGFHFDNLRTSKNATITSNGKTFHASIDTDGTLTITDANDTAIPHYITMYFSWSVHDDNEKIIWKK